MLNWFECDESQSIQVARTFKYSEKKRLDKRRNSAKLIWVAAKVSWFEWPKPSRTQKKRDLTKRETVLNWFECDESQSSESIWVARSFKNLEKRDLTKRETVLNWFEWRQSRRKVSRASRFESPEQELRKKRLDKKRNSAKLIWVRRKPVDSSRQNLQDLTNNETWQNEKEW